MIHRSPSRPYRRDYSVSPSDTRAASPSIQTPGKPLALLGTSGLKEVRVRNVGDEHVPGCVRDGQREPRAGQRDLRRDAAGPEDGHVTGLRHDRITEVRTGQVIDAERGWVAGVHGGAVSRR